MTEKEQAPWRILSSKVVMHDPFLTVEMQQLQLPDGTIIDDWSIINAHDYAMIVAENQVGDLLILDGYRHGPGRSSWQAVGGHIEHGEDPLATAQRELLEEAGYIECSKSFAGRRPKSEYRLTPVGRQALYRYLEHIEAVIKATRRS